MFKSQATPAPSVLVRAARQPDTRPSVLTYLVAVRALCEFTAKHGDLDLRFTPTPSAQEGMAGHAIVASRRGPDYEAEVTLEGSFQELRVRGRADGYDPAANVLEEVKTFRGDLHTMADNRRALHWAQAKIYGHLLCQARALDTITLSLVYFDVASLNETPISQAFTAAELQAYFDLICGRFLVWARQELAHRRARDAALHTLAFPHASFRTGQRELAEAVYKTSQSGGCLMAQATTGIGKTVGTIFPLLKAMPRQRLDKLYFLAAKTPGRQLALDALDLLKTGPAGAAPLPLRVLELVARDKSCEHPDKACHGDSCPLAKGFYDRLPQARTAAVQHASGALLPKAALRQAALDHQVCPYYLSQELVRWADVVVGDYNYYFDSSAMLHTLATTYQWRVAVLVDEAHNLLARARSMYTATLSQAQLQQVYASAPAAVRPALQRLNRAVADVHLTQVTPYVVLPDLPVSLLKTLQQTLSLVTDFLLANPTRVDGELQAFYFEALHFSRMADAFGGHSLLDVTLADGAPPQAHDNAQEILAAGHDCAVLTIRNVVPAPHLTARFTDAQAAVLFSATLSPPEFYQTTLGLPGATQWLDVPSPFASAQLHVAAVQNISTRFHHRTQSLQPMADLMAKQYADLPGNYLVFLSSYDYLQKLQAVLAARHPQIPHWVQSRQMDEAARASFLRRFTDTSRGIGFAVLGGAFAEGVDLPGQRLIGAFIATLGLPQVNDINEQMKARLSTYFAEAAGRQGPQAPTVQTLTQAYNYTYLFPGLQKVVQAAGRVIRTTSDQGIVYLMDDRFSRPEVAALLPSWWHVQPLQISRQAVTRSKNAKQHQHQDKTEGNTQ